VFLQIDVKHIIKYLVELQQLVVPKQEDMNTFEEYFSMLF
jgi:hypothetical protein